ncbi:MAG TPA: cytochrome P450 [Gaiellales bacterium]|nr:cytochrome P450 [Gaiellales bacterium]
MGECFEPLSVRSLAAVLGLVDVSPDTLRRWFAQLAQGATNYERDPLNQATGDAASREIDERLTPCWSGSRASRTTARRDAGARARRRVDRVGADGRARPAEVLAQRPAELVRQAVDEGLRLVSPIGTQFREVKRPVTVAGVELEPGAPVSLVIASANRDERRFDNPDRFDMFRPRRQHAAFGFGRHFCSGHWFSRRQMEIGVAALFERLGRCGLRLDRDRPAVLAGWEFRAPRHLHVRWDRS